MKTGNEDCADTLVAEVAQIKASRQEFMLLFGKRKAGPTSAGELRATLDRRIILSPAMAKRFSVLLDHRIRLLESEFGVLEHEGPPRERLLPTPQMAPPPFRLKIAVETSGLCLELLRRLDVKPAFERSFKIREGRLLQNRFLLGFEKEAVGPHPDETVLQLCEQIGMPPKLMAPFMAQLPEAGIVGFGFGETETTCIAKAYLEFGIRYYRAMKEKPDRPDPYLSHIGYKWDLSDSAKTVVTEYTCYPAYTVKDMLATLSSGVYKERTGSPFAAVEGILEAASRRAGERKFLFLGVGEGGTKRDSFDINLYAAGLKIQEISGDLQDLFGFYGISEEEFQELFEPIRTQTVGHIAGGVGRDGKRFVTIYYGE